MYFKWLQKYTFCLQNSNFMSRLNQKKLKTSNNSVFIANFGAQNHFINF